MADDGLFRIPVDPTFRLKGLDREVAVEEGFVAFNGGPHLPIELPPGHSTLTVKTSGGDLITFAFIPYEDSPHPRCIDIAYHNNGTTTKNGDRDVPTFNATLWTCGQPIATGHDTGVRDPLTLITILLKGTNTEEEVT